MHCVLAVSHQREKRLQVQKVTQAAAQTCTHYMHMLRKICSSDVLEVT